VTADVSHIIKFSAFLMLYWHARSCCTHACFIHAVMCVCVFVVCFAYATYIMCTGSSFRLSCVRVCVRACVSPQVKHAIALAKLHCAGNRCRISYLLN
jgi:hypothetical protein